jgi:hypothetical protein
MHTSASASASASAASASAASASAASASASDGKLHAVNSFRTWIYYLTESFPQSVTDTLMETDQEGDGGGRRGNPKERCLRKE